MKKIKNAYLFAAVTALLCSVGGVYGWDHTMSVDIWKAIIQKNELGQYLDDTETLMYSYGTTSERQYLPDLEDPSKSSPLYDIRYRTYYAIRDKHGEWHAILEIVETEIAKDEKKYVRVTNKYLLHGPEAHPRAIEWKYEYANYWKSALVLCGACSYLAYKGVRYLL